MKNIVTFLLPALLLTLCNACNTHACKDVTCVHGTTQTVNGGCNCTCDTNYQGHNCDTLIDRIRFQFLTANGGPTTWNCTDSCNKNLHYTCTIFGDPTSNAIGILNFENIGMTDTVYAYISGTQVYYPGSQPFNDTVVTNFAGNISADGKTITVQFAYGSNNVPTNNCTGTWAKQ